MVFLSILLLMLTEKSAVTWSGWIVKITVKKTKIFQLPRSKLKLGATIKTPGTVKAQEQV